jgi:hypothetical protein
VDDLFLENQRGMVVMGKILEMTLALPLPRRNYILFKRKWPKLGFAACPPPMHRPT